MKALVISSAGFIGNYTCLQLLEWGNEAAGVLARDRSKAAILEGVNRLFANHPGRGPTRLYAEQFSWQDTAHGQFDLFRRAVHECRNQTRAS